MTKIDVFSGFLGAGKTTLIQKLLKEAYVGEKVVLIENEFGEIGIDGGFLKDAGVEITEMNSGCICCSLVGDFDKALHKVLEQFHPDRILIEPSGVGKLSDVIRAVGGVLSDDVKLNSFTTVADASKCKIYMKNFGEFYNDQIENAGTIILSRTAGMAEEKLEKAVALLREHNTTAVVITTPWEELDGKTILSAMEEKKTLEAELSRLAAEEHDDEDEDDEEHDHDGCHHHDHDDESGHCCHHHDDDDDEHEHCGCHHHHDHEDEDEHEHHHHHHDGECDDPECSCHHHHHHHADEVFSNWGKETTKKFTIDGIRAILTSLDSGNCGAVLRAKGIVAGEDGKWIHFDYVPGEANVRNGSADIIGRLCVIGSKLDSDALAAAFGV